MPWKPRSHAEDMRRRRGRRVTDAEYEAQATITDATGQTVASTTARWRLGPAGALA